LLEILKKPKKKKKAAKHPKLSAKRSIRSKNSRAVALSRAGKHKRSKTKFRNAKVSQKNNGKSVDLSSCSSSKHAFL